MPPKPKRKPFFLDDLLPSSIKADQWGSLESLTLHQYWRLGINLFL